MTVTIGTSSKFLRTKDNPKDFYRIYYSQTDLGCFNKI